MTADLTIEMLQEKLAKYDGIVKPTSLRVRLVKQLLATMRREAFLRETLTIIDMQALNVMQDDVPPYGAILRCGWVHEKCKEALAWSE